MNYETIDPVNPAHRTKADLLVSGIYGLVCPVSKQIRYVGSSKDIAVRFYGHLHSTKSGKVTPKEKWVVNVTALSMSPICVLLERTPISDQGPSRHGPESFWINKLHQNGEADLNIRMSPVTNRACLTLKLREENRLLYARVLELEAKVCKYEELGYDLV